MRSRLCAGRAAIPTGGACRESRAHPHPPTSDPGARGVPPTRRPPTAAPSRHAAHPPPPRSAQQHVPSDSFGGRSPERVAADALRTLFTFAAAKIVLAQLEGSGRGGLAAYDRESYDALSAALACWPAPPPPAAGRAPAGETPTRPPTKGGVAGDAWLAGLARVHPASARRVAEVREAYCASDFEWDSTQRLAVEGTAKANLSLMRELLYDSLAASGGEDGVGGADEM